MTGPADRQAIRERAQQAADRGTPLAWFEELYAGAGPPPWADLRPQPALLSWLAAGGAPEKGRALVVGCGLGDDAEALAGRGFEVTAFDVAPSALEACRERWPETPVTYAVADARQPLAAWHGAFDLIVEIFTLQAIPEALRAPVLEGICACLAPGGTLFLLCRGRDDDAAQGDGPPWALSRAELEAMLPEGLQVASLADFLDREEPPVRRFRLAVVAPPEEG